MKSELKQLRKRGMATEEDILALSKLSFESLTELLHSKEPHIRSAAAAKLCDFVNDAATKLLEQLSEEKCLYTRIAICKSLERGNSQTVQKMISYLGCIGNNQHNDLPDKVSAKKSFPLPRDIIARSLGRMDTSIFPLFLEVLENGTLRQIAEILDSIGYMVFYHPELAIEENCRAILTLAGQHEENLLILWKCILCLSAFPCEESVTFLLTYAQDQTLLGKESCRSLRILEKNKK